MMRTQPCRHAREGGFTLLELLLALGVTAVLVLGISKMTQSWATTEVSDSAGRQLQRITEIGQSYVIANWSIKPTGLPASANIAADVAAAPPNSSPWEPLITSLQAEGLMNGSNIKSPLGADLQMAYVISGNIRRFSIFSASALPNNAILRAARQAGQNGGTISSFPNINRVISAFGLWPAYTVADLQPGGSTFPCGRTATKGCLVSIVNLDIQSLCGPFLYRDFTDCTDGNTMQTTLNMNSHDISQINKMQTNDLNVEQMANLGTTNVNGPATFNGPTTMAAKLIVANDMDVSGDASFAQNMDAQSGTVNATTLNAQTIDVKSIDTNKLNTVDLNVVNGNITADKDMTVNGNIIAQDLNGTGAGQVIAGQFDAGSINTGINGDITVGTMTVQNAMNINGNVDITSGIVLSDKLVVDKCVTIRDAAPATTYTNYGGGPC